MALVGNELGKDVGQWFRPSASAGAIKYVDVAIFAAYMLISLFRSLVQSFPYASLGISVASTARSSRRMCIWHHTITSSPQTIDMGRACGGRTHRYSAWNRRSQPDLLRDNQRYVIPGFSSSFSCVRFDVNEYEGALYIATIL